MAISYLRGPAGQVMDMDPDKGGDVQLWLDHGWVEISKAEYDPALEAQIASAAVRRQEWIDELDDNDLLAKGVEMEKVALAAGRSRKK